MPTDFIEAVLLRLDVERKLLWPIDVSFPLYEAGSREQLTAVQEAGLRQDIAVWEFSARRGKASRWGTFYGPTHEAIQEDGTEQITPDIQGMDDATLVRWQSRLQVVSHPALVARYADVLWDLSRAISPTARRDVGTARVAIDAYQQQVKLSLSHAPPLDLDRALQLAIEISDAERVESVSLQLLDLSEQEPLSLGMWFSAARAFEGRKVIRQVHIERMTQGLEKRMAAAAIVLDVYVAEKAGKALVKVYRRGSKHVDCERVLRVLADTYLRASKDATAGIAIAWLQNTATLLEDEKLYADAEVLRLEMELRGPEVLAAMKTIEVETTIPMEEINQGLDHIIDADYPLVALIRLVHSLIPRCDTLRTRIKQVDQEFPFRNLIHRSIVGRDGIPIASIGSSENDPDGRMLEEIVHDLQFNAALFVLGYRKIKDKYALTVEQIADFTRHSLLVTPDIQAAISESLTAYEAGDYFKTISTCIPKLEAMLRELLKLLKVPTRKRLRNTEGASELKNMNDILRDPRVRETLEEDLLFFMRAVFIEKIALNLRNEAAHGEIPAHGFNEGTASLVIMSLLALAAIGPHTAHIPRHPAY